MRERAGRLHFSPRLPQALDRIAFRLRIQGRILRVTVREDHATYALLSGEPLAIAHGAERVELAAGRRPRARSAPREPVA
jgi:alpha,alpha-trehalose phosphorylase